MLALLAVGAVASSAAPHALAQDDNTEDEQACPGEDDAPEPTAVEISSVPVTVSSTTADYFVLYVLHDRGGEVLDLPVLVKLGEDDTTALAENVEALPAERYRVEKYLVANPADVDGDCIDDITELDDPVGMNPVNPAITTALSDGTAAIPDQETLEAVSVSGRHLKFVVVGMNTDRPAIYFANANTHPDHLTFLKVLGLTVDQADVASGNITYFPDVVLPDGSPGVYVFWLDRSWTFSRVSVVYSMVASGIPLLEDNLAFFIKKSYLQHYQSELPLYRESRVDFVFYEDVWPESFFALNLGEGYGLLRSIDPNERPNPRDVVVYEALPNDLPRVAGTITTVPQTPLSHVNLRAIQDRVPNAFIRDALDNDDINDLIGSHVHYEVTEHSYQIRAATRAEVDAHYASLRPAAEQTPQRDLSVTSITPLSEIGLEDWDAFGVKAANVAVLGTLDFRAGTVPDGFAVPFYFYDEFMKANELYDRVDAMLADPDFQTDFDTQEDELKKLRKAIKNAPAPEYITEALTAMHASYPEGQSLRYRSSTNNEDLPGFNGAGLYDSKTQHPDETEEDGIAKSLKQVYASLWNFRAFAEREFHRIDHKAVAMGVLVHPNYSDELVNGVAVSFDVLRGKHSEPGDESYEVYSDRYYVNSQVGEDLVTNPDALSVPEEVLLADGSYSVVATSNQVPRGQLLMSDDQLTQMRDHLEVIHDEFAELYGAGPGERWAIEIEFKITSDNKLAIKQARPWVFDTGGAGGSETNSETDTDSATDCETGSCGRIGPNPGPSGPSGPNPGPSGPSAEEESARVEPAGFTDVDPHSAHSANIDALFAAGITTGCAQQPLRYCPSQPVTRAHMATFLTRALDLTTPDEPAGFTDVDPHSAHSANIDALFAAGITKGCDTEPLRYCPSQPVTRAHMATFLIRALDLTTPDEPAGFTDVDPQGTHSAAIDALFAADITKGCNTEPLRYCPSQPVTRAHMATFLTRALQLPTPP